MCVVCVCVCVCVCVYIHIYTYIHWPHTHVHKKVRPPLQPHILTHTNTNIFNLAKVAYWPLPGTLKKLSPTFMGDAVSSTAPPALIVINLHRPQSLQSAIRLANLPS